MRNTLLVVALSSLWWGCAGKFNKLEEVEQEHFRALQVFMDKDMEKEYFKLKEQAERDAWLKEMGFWENFYKHPPEVREEILNGDVKVGWHRYQVYMAWGNPSDKRRLTGREASRSELLIYRFEVDKFGDATPLGRKASHKSVRRMQIDVYVDDDRITEMKTKDAWD